MLVASPGTCLSDDAWAFWIRKCGNEKNLEEGRRIYRSLTSCGRSQCTYLGNLLVQMYAKCGSMQDASLAFGQIAWKNSHSWGILIQAYVENDLNREALKVLCRMDCDGVKPQRVIFINLLNACSKLRILPLGELLHSRICSRRISDWDIVLDNALLNMYSKCGAVVHARRLFEGMPNRDVISWSIMISAFAQSGHYGDAVVLFTEMPMEANELTFLSVLDACSNKDDLRIHDLARKAGFDTGLVVGTALVEFYGRQGLLQEAKLIFDGMRERDSFSWYAVISAYIQSGEHREHVFNLFRQMLQDGYRPEAMVLASVLGACSGAKDLTDVRKIHEFLQDNDLHRGVSISNTLIRTYGKCGDLEAASLVFIQMEVRDVISWSAMIAVLGEHARCEDAFKHFRIMELQGYKADEVTFLSLLDACSIVGNLMYGHKIHSRIEATIECNLSLSNSLINMYGKCGSLESARKIFNEVPLKNVVCWTSMISACIHQEQWQEGLDLFWKMESQGVEANSFTFVAVLDACKCLGALEDGRNIHSRIGEHCSHRLATSLIQMYVNCGSLEEACKVFEGNVFQGTCVPAWNAMIGAYTHGFEALDFYRKMNLEGVRPDGSTFAAVLSAWWPGGCEMLLLKEVRKLHENVIESGYEVDVVLATNVIHLYGKCSNSQEARAVFDRIQNKDTVAWNAMLGAYNQHEHGKSALELFEQMDLEPNVSTFVAALEACASTAGSLERAKELHKRIVDLGLDSTDVTLGTSLVHVYAKLGKLEEARMAFEKIRDKNTPASWTAIIAAYALHKANLQALQLLWKMDLEGVAPDETTLLSILRACSHSGLLDEGISYIVTMVGDHDLKARIEHYVTIVDLLARAGRMHEAEELIDFMPYEPSPVAWNTLLAACKTQHDPIRGRRVGDYLLNKFEVESSGPYLSLSNIRE